MLRGTLDRYLLRETAAATLAVTLVLLAIMLSARFAKFLGAVATGDLPRNLLAQVVALSSIQYLVLLIPAALLLAVMLTLGRLYKDSEVAAMMGCGVSLGGLYRPFLFLSALMALITGLLAFNAGPWAGRHVDYISKDARRLVQYTPFEPGRFKVVAGGRAVFYTEQIDTTGEKLTTVFVRIEEDKGAESVVIASEGRQLVDPATGERHVTPPQFAYTSSKRKLAATSDLIASDDSEDKAELAWRIAAPVSVFVLGLLAVPLSHLAPRQGRYGKLVLGIVLYLVYSNLLGLGQAWIAKERVPAFVGLWWVHLLFAGAAVWMIAQRQGWTLRRTGA